MRREPRGEDVFLPKWSELATPWDGASPEEVGFPPSRPHRPIDEFFNLFTRHASRINARGTYGYPPLLGSSPSVPIDASLSTWGRPKGGRGPCLLRVSHPGAGSPDDDVRHPPRDPPGVYLRHITGRRVGDPGGERTVERPEQGKAYVSRPMLPPRLRHASGNRTTLLTLLLLFL